jgi:HD-GYP domain-containing protein (c-di-GMP phosphodiesterase class II)
LSSSSSVREEGRRLVIDVLSRKRAEIIAIISDGEMPSTPFFAFLRQTKKRFFATYIDALKKTIDTGDTTDFLGNETFQSYSHAKNGFDLREVLQVPTAVKTAINEILLEMVEAGQADGSAALAAAVLIDELLGQAETIRSQAFTQTRDETIAFFHDRQADIDNFPSNLASTLDLNTLLRSAMKKCIELVGVRRCAFFSRDLMTNQLHVIAANFEHERTFGDGPIILDEVLLNKLVHELRPVVIEGYRRSMPLITASMKRMKTKVVLLVPLVVRSRNVGVMLLDKAESPQMFTPEVVDLAVRFANRVAASMENARLHGSEQQKLKETIALLEFTRLVSSTLDIDVLLSRLAQIAADICGVVKCSVYVCMDEDNRFYPAVTYSSVPDTEWETSLGFGVLPEDLEPDHFEALFESHSVVISDPASSPFIPVERVDDSWTRSVVLVPVYTRERLLGIVVLYHPKEPDELEPDELNLVAAIAAQAAFALDNASLYENLEMSYFSTVKALARAIEVKDPYTYGHSDRVTEYAIAIARRLGLSEREKNNIKYAAALHDIGKIGIARKILDKPGGLTQEEFNHIKTHPQLGDSIIEPIPFLQGPRRIILHHHERFDGKGYPEGLAGDEIDLEARILSVADAFEAMMSDRPYRKALPLDRAVRELRNNSGSQFDPVVVEAFLDVLKGGELARVSRGATAGRDADL